MYVKHFNRIFRSKNSVHKLWIIDERKAVISCHMQLNELGETRETWFSPGEVVEERGHLIDFRTDQTDGSTNKNSFEDQQGCYGHLKTNEAQADPIDEERSQRSQRTQRVPHRYQPYVALLSVAPVEPKTWHWLMQEIWFKSVLMPSMLNTIHYQCILWIRTL